MVCRSLRGGENSLAYARKQIAGLRRRAAAARETSTENCVYPRNILEYNRYGQESFCWNERRCGLVGDGGATQTARLRGDWRLYEELEPGLARPHLPVEGRLSGRKACGGAARYPVQDV